MARRQKTLILFVSVALMFSVAGWFGSYFYSTPRSKERESAIANREVVTVSYMALSSFRNKGTNAMLRGIEGTLDHGVCQLWESRSMLDGSDYRSALELLHNVKQYRKQHPRPISVRLDLARIQRKADIILRDLMENPVGVSP